MDNAVVARNSIYFVIIIIIKIVKIIHRQRRELTQNFDNLAALLNFNLNQPIPERPELLQMAHQRIIQLRKQLHMIQ